MTETVLVTGATGFVGSHLVRHLLAQGRRVVALLRAASDTTPLPTDDPALLVYLTQDDARDLSTALIDTRPRTVFHLAARFTSEHEPADVSDLISSNVAFGTHLLEAMLAAGTSRLVYTSTIWRRHGELDEEPVNLYAATKAAFDPILGFYTVAHELSTIALELADTYGPGDRRGKIVATLLRAAAHGAPIELSPGEQRLYLTHIDDVVAALNIAEKRLDNGWPGSLERFHVLPDDTVSLRELAHSVERIVGAPVHAEWGARPYRVREVMTPASQHQRLPGWTPRVALKDGLRSLLP